MTSRTRLAVKAGALAAGLSRAARKGQGSVVGGHAILAIDPGALSHLSKRRVVALVSGTNGKTTTTKFVAQAVGAHLARLRVDEPAGQVVGTTTAQGPAAGTGRSRAARRVVTNTHGANMPAGLVTTLAGSQEGDVAVLEVDEAWLPQVAAEVRPRALVLLNLSRDQLDRHHEVRNLAHEWAQMCRRLPAGAVVVANADDPLVVWAAKEAPAVTWVGAGSSWRLDSVGCPACGGLLMFGGHELGAGPAGGPGDGPDGRQAPWRCRDCGLARPQPEVVVSSGGTAQWRSGPEQGREVHLEVGLPGRVNQSNALMALLGAQALGVVPELAAAAIAVVTEVAGRYSRVELGGAVATLFLAKNPAGWLEALEMLAPAPVPVVVAINARPVDGRDTSWLWDVPFERLVGRPVVASGERSYDLSVRLHYAEVGHQVHHSLAEAARSLGAPACQVVANYSAFQDLLATCGPAGSTSGALRPELTVRPELTLRPELTMRTEPGQ